MVQEIMAICQVQLSSLFFQRKEKSMDRSKGEAAYLLMEEG